MTIHPLEQRFFRVVRDRQLFGPQDRLLVAVSGGADSMALLQLLTGPHAPPHAALHAAHLDHGLRPESGADAAFVRAACECRGVPLHLARVEVRALAGPQGGGIEEAGREARRQFLRRVAADNDLNLVLLAHQRDDQAETVLHRLLRGSGPAGLAAMLPREGLWVRPLLEIPRAELEAYLDQRGVSFVTDVSNHDPAFTRNRLRHEVLPLLRSLNPQVDAALARFAALSAEEESFWQARVAEAWQTAAEVGPEEVCLDLALVAACPPALQRRLLRAALKMVRGDLRGLEARHLGALERLLHGAAPQGDLHLPGAWIGRRYQRLRLRPAAPEPLRPGELALAGEGVFTWLPNMLFRVALAPPGAGGARVLELAVHRLPLPLTVRSFRPGDRLRLPGGGRKKVKEIFAEARLSREARRVWPLLVHGEEILWVVGLRRSGGLPTPGEGAAVLRVVAEMPENPESFLVT